MTEINLPTCLELPEHLDLSALRALRDDIATRVEVIETSIDQLDLQYAEARVAADRARAAQSSALEAAIEGRRRLDDATPVLRAYQASVRAWFDLRDRRDAQVRELGLARDTLRAVDLVIASRGRA